MINLYLRLVLLLLMGFSAVSSYAVAGAAFSYLGLEASARDVSMAGSATAYPKGVSGFLTSPTALSEPTSKIEQSPISFYLSSYPLLFDYRNNTIFGQYPLGDFTIGNYFQAISSEDFEIVDDFGASGGKVGERFFSFGFGISKVFKLNREKILTGANLKTFYSSLGDFSAFNAVVDLGVSYFFRLARPQWLPYYSDLPNTTLAINIKNIGIGSAFETNSELPPYSYEISARSGIFSRRAHEADLYASFEHTFLYDQVSFALGFEYTFLKLLYIRGGWQVSTLKDSLFSVGMGFETEIQNKYKITADYSMQNSTFETFNHIVGLGFSYKLEGKKIIENPKLDYEIAAEVQRFIEKLFQKSGIIPQSFDEILLEMERDGYPEPRLTSGKIQYVPQLRLAIYVRYVDNKKQNNVIQLQDGTMVLGIINRPTEDGLIIDGEFGDLLIPYQKIKTIENLEMNEHDREIKIRIQYLVDMFKEKKERFPVDLQELAAFCKETMQVLPKTVQRQIKYDPATGQVLLF